MGRRLQRRIRYASARRFGASALLLLLYSTFFFALPSPFTRARDAAGGRLPELIAGFPAGEPMQTLLRLGAARSDYVWMQAFDLLLVALIAVTAVSAMSIALRRLTLSKGDAQYVLLLPGLYVFFELLENALLALFASGAAPPEPPLVLVQQLATTAKIGSLILTALFGLTAAFALALSTAVGKRKGAPSLAPRRS